VRLVQAARFGQGAADIAEAALPMLAHCIQTELIVLGIALQVGRL
jgi:hypothetical protein